MGGCSLAGYSGVHLEAKGQDGGREDGVNHDQGPLTRQGRGWRRGGPAAVVDGEHVLCHTNSIIMAFFAHVFGHF